jgi:penicillin-binding protein 1C
MRRLKRRYWILSFFLVLSLMVLGSLFLPLPGERFQKENIQSLRVLDRRGVLLREFLNDEQGRGAWKSLEEVSPALLQAIIAVEDKRFYYHPGVDPIALVRALAGNIRAGAFRSGGSTLTQQVIRNVYHHPRTLYNKLLEMWYALRLERMMHKREILEQYINRAPYGNQLFGVESASRWYFGKPARDLSLAEAALIAGLPNAPSVLNPNMNPEEATARSHVVLARMLEQRLISADEYGRALEQPLSILPPQANFRAPHFVEMVAHTLRAHSDMVSAQTTLDYALQSEIHWLIKGHLVTLETKNVTNASVVVLENETRCVRALVGSVDFFDESHQGQVNGALALRQPGSSIKPFTYGVALEAGFSPAQILADVPTQIPDAQGDYIPQNYDRHYHGPVRLRTALACSYNVPAVRVAQQVGVETILDRLHRAGFESLAQPASFYGYGLTLGNGEVTLLELTNAYASLANQGRWMPVQLLEHVRRFSGVRSVDEAFTAHLQPARAVFDERVAYVLTDILSDPVARKPAFGNAFHFPFRCAVKTGTTKDYRDNWTVGYTTEYTVGVWVGNFNGTPMRGVSGITGAGQIFSDIMMLLHRNNPPRDFSVPVGLQNLEVCPRSGMLPTPACGKSIIEWFQKGKGPVQHCNVHQTFEVTTETGGRALRVYEVFRPEFSDWAEVERLPRVPANATPARADNPAGNRSQPIILYPNNGDQFKLDPILRPEYQSLKIVGAAPDKSRSISILVDNDVLDFNPSGVWWSLKRGKHTFRLEAIVGDRKRISKPVAIEVN